MINRRFLLKGLLAVPAAAIAATVVAALTPKQGEFPEEIRIPVTTSLNQGPSTKIGTLTINIKCDTDVLERDLERMRHAIKSHIRNSRF